MAEKIEKRSVSVRIDGKEVENTLKSITKKTNELYQEVSKLPQGTQAYIDKLEEYHKAKDLQTAHRKEVAGIKQAWYDNIPAIKDYMAVAAGVFAIDQIVDYGKALYNTAKEIDNIARKSVSVLKEQLAGVNAEAKENARDIGLAREQYVGLATDVTAFLQSQKFTRAEAARMSTEVINLSGVLGQFSGGGKEKTIEALDAIKGAFAEDVEQLAKFNIAISENVIQTKMLEMGLDKANAAVQQKARGMIILEMITKGAKAQTEAFSGSADGMVRSQARVEAMLQTIENNLAKFFIPLFEKALNVITPFVETLGDFSEVLGDIVNPSKAASEAFYEQKEKVRQLDEKLPSLLQKYDHLSSKSKLNKTEQTKLKDVIQQIGEIVPTAKIEIDKYGNALKINAGNAREFLAAQKTLSEYLNKDAIAAEEKNIKQLEYNQLVAKRFVENINTGKIIGSSGPFGANYLKDNEAKLKAVKKFTDDLNVATKDLEGAKINLKRLRGEPLTETKYEDKVDMSGESLFDKKKREKTENDTLKNLQKLREIIAAHNAYVAALDADNEAQAVARIREKYRKDIELAESLEKEKGKVGEEAHKLKLQLQTQRDAEISNIYNDALDKQLDALEKHLDDANLKNISADEREAQQIYDKYQKNIEAAKRVEIDRFGATELERSRAHTLRLGLEAARDKEIEDARSLRAANASQKEMEESAKFLAQRQKERDDLKKQIENEINKPLENQGDNPNETTPQYLVRIQSAQALEKEQLRLHFEELLRLADDYGINTAGLREKQKQQEASIDAKYQALTIKRQQEEHVKKVQAYGQLYGELGNLATSFGELVGAEGERSAQFQKVMTLAQIAFDTASAISSLTKYSEANPANAVTGGIAGTIQFVSGLARIITNIAKAKQVLSTGPVVKQKFDGGPVVGEQDGETYYPHYAGNASTGMVNRPTLFQSSSGTPFLTGEKYISEYVIAGPELKLPGMPNFLGYIEAKRKQRVRGFMDGGSVEPSAMASTVSNIGSNIAPSGAFPWSELMSILMLCKEAFDKGIIMRYEDIIEFERMQRKLNDARL
jgi:hypothetical protein